MAKYHFLDLLNEITPPEAADSSDIHDREFPTPDAVAERLNKLSEVAGRSQIELVIDCLGASYVGREIRSVTIGSGEIKVLLWSQMHGDEPTHTFVLLDVLDYLVQSPTKSTKLAQAVLANCTLTMIPMLNPDGSLRRTRRNAQNIDINRDARVLQAPESRVLRDAVLRIQPDFAFNLHNHNARRTIASSGQLAAVALLAPPPDAEGSEPPHLVRAKQVGSAFCMSVANECKDMIWRYGADYMPRAFGEWVQSQGVSTLLVEAGGWPGDNKLPLISAHSRGLLGALAAIATDELESTGTDLYEALPRGQGHDRIDCVIRNCRLVEDEARAFQTDIGINFEDEDRNNTGAIVEIGDLSVHDSDRNIDGSKLTCRPGDVALCNSISAANLFEQKSEDCLIACLRQGITTVVGVMAASDFNEAESSKQSATTNVAFAIKGDGQTTVEQLSQAVAFGVVLMLDQSLTPTLRNHAERLGLAVVPFLGDNEPIRVISWESVNSPSSFELPRGQVKLGTPADLVLRDAYGDVRTVLINGQIVLDNGKEMNKNAGRVLCGRYGKVN